MFHTESVDAAGTNVLPHAVVDGSLVDCIVDRFRSSQAAERAARVLNEGRARVNPHALYSCRIEEWVR